MALVRLDEDSKLVCCSLQLAGIVYSAAGQRVYHW